MRSVRTKLLGSFFIVLVFVFVLGLNGLTQIKKMSDFTQDVTKNWMYGIETINQVNVSIEQFLSNYYQTSILKDADALKKVNDKMGELVGTIDTGIKKYGDTVAEGDKADYATLQEAWARFVKGFTASNAGKLSEAESAANFEEISKAFADLRISVDKLIVYNHAGAEQSEVNSDKLYTETSSALFYLGIVIVLVIAALAWALIENITKPLRATTAMMNRISTGDLTVKPLEIKRKDEFGVMMESVNKTLNNLQQSVKQLQESATSVATASSQLYASSEQNSEAARHVSESIGQVASGSEDQANTAAECGRVIDEMAEGVQRIAETTGDVSELSQQAAARANNGSEKIIEVSDRMKGLYDSVEQASITIRKLEQQSSQISEISALIGDIAARTNLLALNAAIEAARAGEHGKGFAVVAGEVRKLASQSDESSQGIIELIASIQEDTKSASATMKKSLAEVQEGVLAVEHAETAFREIVISTGEVSNRVQEAAAAAEQLAASSEEVAASIANMGHIARQTAGMSQQVAASTEEQLASSEEMTKSSQTLSGIAKDMQVIVKKFTL
ncbi:methyl-accepting chemotaxis protein [Cohnella lupini]|uniref:Methyl-accepting chemotaxis sensory transducer n=1 Tax=Cohnella lupini TaxID=1294267 RepID=A0A3D9IF75_9BACL|nr:HAMP domain-containing methyl-accepting chemotaxis protein [Cohnella lupini]RED60335.1 methyl-accepting chemotaxis sensory transducer [Cohnella lupini]